MSLSEHIKNNAMLGVPAALGAKAPINSPALTGTPTAPTAPAGTNTGQLATTAFVKTAVLDLVNAAPAALDTLNEIAAALNDDPSFAATITNALAAKVNVSGLSLMPTAGKIPLAGADGRISRDWLRQYNNDIGTPGAQGFGVGICPALPAGFSALSGSNDPASDNYGNYLYTDGSVMVWVPAFYFRLNHASNPTYGVYGVNSISILPLAAFPDDGTANAQGYYLHRAFVNAGANQLGFFRDKYDCSNNAGTASSKALAIPMVSAPGTGQVGFSALTGAPANAYYGAILAAKTRGAKFFPESAFIADALCRITTAHAQAAISTTWCAWYDAARIKNFPKGNNNGALKDVDDLTVTFTSAEASSQPNMALTGSGSNLAKTTHNGQACGITDVAGNIYKINPSMTCIATSKSITGATQANPVALTVVAHGCTTGDVRHINGVVGMTQINERFYTVTVVDVDHITLDGVDGAAFTAYASAGSLLSGVFYTLKPSVDIAAVTSGATLATDHWGATGVAAQFDVVTMNFATAYPNNGIAQRYGNGANAVFDMSTANGRALAMLGMPAAGGMSVAGSNAMGLDYYYQYIRDQLCVLSRGNWDAGSLAGSRNRYLPATRTGASYNVGFAAASYL